MPLILPVAKSNVNPVGQFGLTFQFAITPLVDGTTVVIGVPTDQVNPPFANV